jgi:surface antigen
MARRITTLFLAVCVALFSAAASASMNPFGPTGLPLTQDDFAAMAVAVDPLLNNESTPIGTSRDWNNDKSGNHGKITLLERFQYKYNGSNLNCRKLQYRFVIKGDADPYNVDIDRCLVDGKWKFL